MPTESQRAPEAALKTPDPLPVSQCSTLRPQVKQGKQVPDRFERGALVHDAATI